MPLIAALLLLLVFSPSIALAQEIPEYDSEAHCKRVAESAAKPSATLGRCLWLEEYSLDELETFWPGAKQGSSRRMPGDRVGEESYVVREIRGAAQNGSASCVELFGLAVEGRVATQTCSKLSPCENDARRFSTSTSPRAVRAGVLTSE